MIAPCLLDDPFLGLIGETPSETLKLGDSSLPNLTPTDLDSI